MCNEPSFFYEFIVSIKAIIVYTSATYDWRHRLVDGGEEMTKSVGPKPSRISQTCQQRISSPKYVTNIDVGHIMWLRFDTIFFGSKFFPGHLNRLLFQC